MPGRHRPVATLATVAEAAGVSRQTVSNALNSPELLRPDTLARVQQAIDRARLHAQPRRPQPAHPHLPPRRAAARPRGRGHRERAHGPLPALARRVLQGGRAARAAVHRRGRQRPARRLRRAARAPRPSTRSSSPTPTAATRRRRGWRSGRCPSSRSAGPGRSPQATFPWVDVDGRAGVDARRRPPRRPRPRADRLGRLAEDVATSARTGAAAGSTGCTSADLSTTRLSARGEDTIEFGRRAAHALLDSDDPTAFVCVSDTVAMGVLQALADRGRHARARTTSRSSASTTRSPPRSSRPG